MKRNLKEDFVINILNAIISFLSKHSFDEEVNAIYEGLKDEKSISSETKSSWERLLKSK